MTTRHLEATVRHHGGVPIIDLNGEINAFAEDALDSAYDEATRENPDAVLLNFRNVDYINSTGIALIVGLLSKAMKSSLRIVTFSLSAHYEELFRITRLADFTTMFADEKSALADTVKTE